MTLVKYNNEHLDEYLDFQKYWLVMKRRWLLATLTFMGIVGVSLVYALTLPLIYEGEAKLLIKKDRSATLTGIENETGKIEVISQDSDPLTTEAEIIRSRPIVETLIRELNLRDDEGEFLKYRDVVESLKVKTITGTDVLQITYQDKDPELVASVVNKAIQIYQKQDILYNRTEATTARTFITQQLPQVEANLKEAEAELRKFKNRYRIANLEKETTKTITNLSQLENDVDAVKVELEDVEARYNRLRFQLGISWQEASALAAISQSVGVKSTFDRLQQVKLELTQKRNYLSEVNPQIISLRGEVAELQQALNLEIEKTLGREQQKVIKNVNIFALGGGLNQGQISEFAELGLQREGLQKRIAALNNIYNSNKQRADILPQLEEQQKELERRVEAAQSTYKILLNKLQETRIAEEQDVGKVRVISAAVVPEKHIGPSKKKIVAAGGILGGLLAVAMAFLLDIRDKTIKNTKEAEEMLAYPLYGVIPKLKSLDTVKQLAGNSSSVEKEIPMILLREAYQNIQYNLSFIENNKEIRSIAITSAVSGEGKSFISANYAKTVAQSGKKVLLIDGDLRHPSQHKNWKINNRMGLTNILNEKILWHDAVQNVMPQLDILTAGTVPDNPVTLLDSLSMIILVKQLLEHYDRIIFDTPPLVGLADSKIIGKLVDGLLFIVRPGVANYTSITAAKKVLETQEMKVLGVVTNGVNLDKEPLGYEAYYADKKYLEASQ